MWPTYTIIGALLLGIRIQAYFLPRFMNPCVSLGILYSKAENQGRTDPSKTSHINQSLTRKVKFPVYCEINSADYKRVNQIKYFPFVYFMSREKVLGRLTQIEKMLILREKFVTLTFF